jgi:Na+/H+-dicarboxylate symporter
MKYLKSKKLFSPIFLYLIAIGFGVLSGFSEIEILRVVGTSVSNIFIKLFKCLSLPLIGLSIIVTIVSYSPKTGMKNLWQRTLFYTLSTTLAAATLTCFLYRLIQPEPANGVADGGMSFSLSPFSKDATYLDSLFKMIPSNIFEPFLEHQVGGVLLVAIAIGCAIRQIPDEVSKQTIGHFFQGLHGMFLVITRWVVKVIPLALYGFITQTVLQLKAGLDLTGITGYLAIIVLANILQGFIILPLWLGWNGVSPLQSFKGMLPALSVAFFSKSSAGTLPVTLESAEKRLNVHPDISRFVLPLCTSINMNGCAAFIFATVIYLMENHGIQISFMTMIVWIFISTLAAIGNAGVPMGCFFLSASLLSSMGVPIHLLGIILPFYGVIDMIETSLNVWSDSCVAIVLDKKLREEAIVPNGSPVLSSSKA